MNSCTAMVSPKFGQSHPTGKTSCPMHQGVLDFAPCFARTAVDRSRLTRRPYPFLCLFNVTPIQYFLDRKIALPALVLRNPSMSFQQTREGRPLKAARALF